MMIEPPQDAAPVASPRERILGVLLDLRGVLPYAATLVTVRPIAGQQDQALIKVGYNPDIVQHVVADYIPRSPSFRLAANRTEDVLDWNDLPSFRATMTAQYLMRSGFQQGVSFLLGSGPKDALGSFHVSITQDRFSGPQAMALHRARAQLTRAVRGLTAGRRASLGRRELQVLAHLALGESNRQIAEALGTTRRTVDSQVESILTKLGAANRVQAVVEGIKVGLIVLKD